MSPDKVTHIRLLDGGGEPPDMDQRIRQLEHDMAVVKETMATRDGLNGVRLEVEQLRAELHRSMAAQTWKLATTIMTSMGLMTAIFAAIVKWL